jgi:hypothetical protein
MVATVPIASIEESYFLAILAERLPESEQKFWWMVAFLVLVAISFLLCSLGLVQER